MMARGSGSQTVVVNFNSPELNYLAGSLADDGQLARYVRPYINKRRAWERALERSRFTREWYSKTFGRRTLPDDRLASLTTEAGVLYDISAALVARARRISVPLRSNMTVKLHEAVRHAVARRAVQVLGGVDCVVAYTGFGLPAFHSMRRTGAGTSILNYPIAHHAEHRRMQLEERELEPEFAATWRGIDEWKQQAEEEANEEIGLCDRILLGSDYAAKTFSDQGVSAEKLWVIPYGVDHRTFNDRLPAKSGNDHRFTAIFSGQLTQRKGISYLLKGYREFARQDSVLRLVGNMVDDGRAFRPFQDFFEHVPHLTRPLLAMSYRSADVFVFPTLLEGMGLVVLEAMACGLPVIVTSHGPGDVVRDGVDGFVVPIRDSEAIADRLERLYRDPELRHWMSRNAVARAREFSWARYTNSFKAHLADLRHAS